MTVVQPKLKSLKLYRESSSEFDDTSDNEDDVSVCKELSIDVTSDSPGHKSVSFDEQDKSLKYTCRICDRHFPNEHMYDCHLQENHDSSFTLMTARTRMFQCLIESCGSRFRSPKDRDEHMKDYHKYPSTFSFSNLLDCEPTSQSPVQSLPSPVRISSIKSSTSFVRNTIVPETIRGGDGTLQASRLRPESPLIGGSRKRRYSETLSPPGAPGGPGTHSPVSRPPSAASTSSSASHSPLLGGGTVTRTSSLRATSVHCAVSLTWGLAAGPERRRPPASPLFWSSSAPADAVVVAANTAVRRKVTPPNTLAVGPPQIDSCQQNPPSANLDSVSTAACAPSDPLDAPRLCTQIQLDTLQDAL